MKKPALLCYTTLLIAISSFYSCKRNNNAKPTPTITGTWHLIKWTEYKTDHNENIIDTTYNETYSKDDISSKREISENGKIYWREDDGVGTYKLDSAYYKLDGENMYSSPLPQSEWTSSPNAVDSQIIKKLTNKELVLFKEHSDDPNYYYTEYNYFER